MRDRATAKSGRSGPRSALEGPPTSDPEFQRRVESLYGPAEFVGAVEGGAPGRTVYVFRVGGTAGVRTVRAWREKASIVVACPVERPPLRPTG
jgi:hypothetical protein